MSIGVWRVPVGLDLRSVVVRYRPITAGTFTAHPIQNTARPVRLGDHQHPAFLIVNLFPDSLMWIDQPKRVLQACEGISPVVGRQPGEPDGVFVEAGIAIQADGAKRNTHQWG